MRLLCGYCAVIVRCEQQFCRKRQKKGKGRRKKEKEGERRRKEKAKKERERRKEGDKEEKKEAANAASFGDNGLLKE